MVISFVQTMRSSGHSFGTSLCVVRTSECILVHVLGGRISIEKPPQRAGRQFIQTVHQVPGICACPCTCTVSMCFWSAVSSPALYLSTRAVLCKNCVLIFRQHLSIIAQDYPSDCILLSKRTPKRSSSLKSCPLLNGDALKVKFALIGRDKNGDKKV